MNRPSFFWRTAAPSFWTAMSPLSAPPPTWCLAPATNGRSDTVDGGAGFNTFEVLGNINGYTVTGTAAAATVKTGAITYTLTNVQAVAFAPAAPPFPGIG